MDCPNNILYIHSERSMIGAERNLHRTRNLSRLQLREHTETEKKHQHVMLCSPVCQQEVFKHTHNQIENCTLMDSGMSTTAKSDGTVTHTHLRVTVSNSQNG